MGKTWYALSYEVKALLTQTYGIRIFSNSTLIAILFTLEVVLLVVAIKYGVYQVQLF